MKFEKYSKLCVKYILNNKLLTPNFCKNIKIIENSRIIQKIRDAVRQPVKLTYSIQLSSSIEQIHNNTSPPLFYLLFLVLYRKKLLDNIIEYKFECFENHNVRQFIEWYNQNQMDIPIDDIKKLMKKHKNSIVNELYEIIFNPMCGDRHNLHNLLYTNTFVPINVQNEAETNIINYTVYRFNDNSIVNIYSPSGIQSVEPTEQIDMVIICKIFDIFRTITGSYDNPINLSIFAGNSRKKIYKNKTKHLSLNPTNINSGSTYPGIEINLWRREEIYKVLIHELIHYFKLDFTVFSPGYERTELFTHELINVKGEDRLFESYTETLANIIHCTLLEHYTGINVGQLLWIETSFSLFQVAKILNYYEFDNFDQLFDKTNNKIIFQTTSVLSYFIIKTGLLLNIDLFFNFMGDNIKFNKKITEYINLAQKCIKCASYSQSVNKHLIFLKNFANVKENDDFIRETLRMTCLQI